MILSINNLLSTLNKLRPRLIKMDAAEKAKVEKIFNP